jgi:hypothetical protein
MSARDHEFERKFGVGDKSMLSAAGITFNPLIYNDKYRQSSAGMGRARHPVFSGNVSKGLALCAARPHIVAVR